MKRKFKQELKKMQKAEKLNNLTKELKQINGKVDQKQKHFDAIWDTHKEILKKLAKEQQQVSTQWVELADEISSKYKNKTDINSTKYK